MDSYGFLETRQRPLDAGAGVDPWQAASARYFVPLSIAFEDHEEERARALGAVAVTKVRQQATMGLLADAMADEPFCRAVVEAIANGLELRGEGGTLHFVPSASFGQIVGDALAGPTPVRRVTTSSNSITLLGERLFLKAYRRLHPGVNPELEMGRHLTDAVGFDHGVPVAGSVEFRATDGTVWPLALLQTQVTHQGDAWTFTVDQLSRLLDEHLRAGKESPAEDGAMLSRMQVLARRVAELHVALARHTGAAAFDPEPVRAADLEHWAATVRDECSQTLALMDRHRADWPEPLGTLAASIASAAPKLNARVDQTAHAAPTGLKTRLHGDLHLGQVLISQDDFVIIDFEGEPNRPVEQRRAKHSALRDVAGMLRSFDYARHTALHQAAQGALELERLEAPARQWERRVREVFLKSYCDVAVAGGLYADEAAFDSALPVLDLFELEKALYELRYEMDNRPDWIGVPLAGIAALADLGA